MIQKDDEISLNNGGRTAVTRRGRIVLRDTGPWAPAVHALLRHLEAVGFAGAPQVVESGFDTVGRETLTYIDGEFTQPGPWSLEGAAAVGRLVRDLHVAVASFQPSAGVVWQDWFGRNLGGEPRIISHCDVAPWNIVARNGLPVALIDWEFAGPVDPLVELAQACWLNAKLHDDIVAEIEGLPPLEERARQLRAMLDAYELPMNRRRDFIDRMIDFVMCDTAEQANEARITANTTEVDVKALGYSPLWALAWRARAGAWLVQHRRVLQKAITAI